uniref:Sperm acrosome membrane-associated protein 3 n=1 Tax=Myotis lucifugus TaxID=59463 RepID=G1NV24_MYOLU
VGGRPGLWSCPLSQSPALSRRGGGSTSASCMEARGWAPRRQLCPPGILLLVVASLLSCLLTCGQAKVYSRCELFRVLQEFGLEGYRGHSLADWLCLAYYTSGFDSAAVDHEADGSTNNGIFQINSRKWCKTLKEYSTKGCNMYCTARVLDPDLKNAVICSMKISQQPQGLRIWEAWKHHCLGKDLSDWVDGCTF